MIKNNQPNNQTAFLRGNDFRRTYNERVLPFEVVRSKFRQFMDSKRKDPRQPWGASDKPFTPGGNFANQVPNLKHAHLTPDLSIVYLATGNAVYLYGFYTHDDLGTGQPPKQPRQKAMSVKFRNTQFG